MGVAKAGCWLAPPLVDAAWQQFKTPFEFPFPIFALV